MNVSEIFVRRPVMTTLVMVGILVFGIVGYRSLPVAALPNVDFPTIQVSASLPGASAQTMASAVATPLEKQFSTIPSIDSMTSSSSPDRSVGGIMARRSTASSASIEPRQSSCSRATTGTGLFRPGSTSSSTR